MRKIIILLSLAMFIFIQPVFSQTDSIESSLNEKYVIGAGDVLEIVTWKEPDFSKENIRVRVDGKITLPLLDDIQAADKTPMELKMVLEKKLEAFLDSPIVTVVLVDPASQKFYVLGEVVNTGEYQIVKQLTVLQAFALAGGFTEWASKKEIILLRNENGKERKIRVDFKKIIRTKESGANLFIKANDTIIVP